MKLGAAGARGLPSWARRPGAIAIGAVGLFYLADVLIHLPGAAHRGDFSAYYLAGFEIRHRIDPYTASLNVLAARLGFHPLPFDHPADTPALNLCIAPLSLLPPVAAYTTWISLQAAALAAAMAILLGPLWRADRRAALVLGAFALAFPPLADDIRWSQTQTLVLAGLALVFALEVRRRETAAGIVLGLLGVLRIYPLAMGGYLLARRRWRAIAWLGATIAAAMAMSVAISGAATMRSYLAVLGFNGRSAWLSLDPRLEFGGANFSLSAFIARPLALLGGGRGLGGFASLRAVAVLAIELAALAASFWATWGATDADGRSFSLWVVTMLLLMPVVWAHYLAVLLAPFALIAIAALDGRVSARTWSWTAAAWCLIVLATPIMAIFGVAFSYRDWRVTALSEFGCISLIAAWLAALSFATETTAPAREGFSVSVPGDRADPHR